MLGDERFELCANLLVSQANRFVFTFATCILALFGSDQIQGVERVGIFATPRRRIRVRVRVGALEGGLVERMLVCLVGVLRVDSKHVVERSASGAHAL